MTGPFRKDPGDEPMAVAGSTFFEVSFDGASGVDLSGSTAVQTYTGPTQITLDHPIVADVAQREDFERVMGWVIGLNQTRCPTAKVESATALVIEFPH